MTFGKVSIIEDQFLFENNIVKHLNSQTKFYSNGWILQFRYMFYTNSSWHLAMCLLLRIFFVSKQRGKTFKQSNKIYSNG